MAATVNSLPVSTSLLTEVNAVGDPGRLKAQDGTIGDTAHEGRASDHNRDEIGNTGSSSDADKIPEVHARDADARGPWKIKGGAERIVQLIVANVRARGYGKRRVKYVIFKRRIWQWRKVNGEWSFVQTDYTGSDPHIEHFHVSFEYGSGSGTSNPENDTSPWGVLAAYESEKSLDANDVKTLLTTDGLINNPSNASDRGNNPTLKLGEAVTNTYFHTLATEKAVASIAALLAGLPRAVVDALASADRSDDDLAAALRTALGDRADAVFRAGLAA